MLVFVPVPFDFSLNPIIKLVLIVLHPPQRADRLGAVFVFDVILRSIGPPPTAKVSGRPTDIER